MNFFGFLHDFQGSYLKMSDVSVTKQNIQIQWQAFQHLDKQPIIYWLLLLFNQLLDLNLWDNERGGGDIACHDYMPALWHIPALLARHENRFQDF